MGVHEAIGGENMVQVAAWSGLVVAAEPTLSPRMFAVVAVAFLNIFAALVLAYRKGIRWRAIGDVGIHVPHHAVAFVVGTPEGVPDLAVINGSVPRDDVVQCGFQFIAGLAVGVVVITGGNLCPKAASCGHEQKQQRTIQKMTFHNELI